jgi:hypothetical protein
MTLGTAIVARMKVRKTGVIARIQPATSSRTLVDGAMME